MVTISETRPTSRRIGNPPYRDLAMVANGHRYKFGAFLPARPLLTPGAEIAYAPARHRVIFTAEDQRLTFELDDRKLGSRTTVNFFEEALGLTGELQDHRSTTDPKYFIERLAATATRRARFLLNLSVKTDSQGAVLIPQNGRTVPCMSARDPNRALRNRQIILAPFWVGSDVYVAVFPKRGPYHDLVRYNPKLRRFYFDTREAEDYLLALEPFGTAHVASLNGQSVYFAGLRRYTHEVVKVRFAQEKLVSVRTHTDPTPLSLNEVGLEDGQTVLTAGGSIGHKLSSLGKRVQVRLTRPGRQFVFLHGPNKHRHTLRDEDVCRLGLKENDLLEVESIKGKVSSLHATHGMLQGEILFILNWEANAQREFTLVDSTSSDIHSDQLVGYRVIEQTETSFRNGAYHLNLGNRKLRLARALPFEPSPTPLAALVRDGREVLFFASRTRFTQKDWSVAKRVVQIAQGTFDTKKIDAKAIALARKKAEEADALASAAQPKILELRDLEDAEKLYTDAFLLNPAEQTYLTQTLELRRSILHRKAHLDQRLRYRKFWEEKKRLLHVPDVWAGEVAQELTHDHYA